MRNEASRPLHPGMERTAAQEGGPPIHIMVQQWCPSPKGMQ